MKKWTRWILTVFLAAVLVGCGRENPEQEERTYPREAVELIAPAGPGGGYDLTVRAMAQCLQETGLVSVPLPVTNKPGGGGRVCLEYMHEKRGSNDMLVVYSPPLCLINLNGSTALNYRDNTTPIAKLAVDYGCFAPVKAFMEAFAHHGVPVTMEETRKPMGMLKRDHIRTMLHMERIAADWKRVHGHEATEEAVDAVYAQFEPKLFSILDQYAAPKPFAVETAAKLREMGVKIGSTTGYTDAMMNIVAPKAAQQGYAPDFWISPDGVGGRGRPYPYMIFANMQALGLTAVGNVVKVGDTISDIKEGVNAGVWTAGVIEGSSELGLSQQEYEAMSPQERETACQKVEERFRRAGAHFVVRDLSQLPDLVHACGFKNMRR